jgi:alpha-aminoadipic semialdehyde synthase
LGYHVLNHGHRRLGEEWGGGAVVRCIGIRREDKDQWEARAPLTPSDLARLTATGLMRFVLQPSPSRAFSDAEYAEAGADIDEDLSSCDIVLAVKEIPQALFRPGKTYVFFSHTIKGQPYNMDMLRRLIELECDLVDYERIRDRQGRRSIYFSRFAGLAGTIDSLWALGRRMDAEGFQPNPISTVEQTHRYGSLSAAFGALAETGQRIRTEGLPPEICPLVIGVSGYGNVSGGALEILEALGATPIQPEDLEALFAAPPQAHSIYSVVFTERDMVEPLGSAQFDLDEYFVHPDRYRGRFDRWLPYLTVLINGIYWDARYPRLVTKAAIRKLFDGGRPRLRVIGDVSCDREGSVEITVKETTIDDPVYVYEPASDRIVMGVVGAGPVVMAVGNLPCELPRESSASFSAALAPLMPALANADFAAPFSALDLPPELKRALILHKGRFTPEHSYMARFI